MATARVNGVRLFYELHGGGAVPLVLVHGSWARLPRELKQTLIDNAPTFLDESKDPEQLVFDLEWVRDFSQPTCLTLGDQSPPIFGPVVGKLVKAMSHAEVLTFPGAGTSPMSPTRTRMPRPFLPLSANTPHNRSMGAITSVL